MVNWTNRVFIIADGVEGIVKEEIDSGYSSVWITSGKYCLYSLLLYKIIAL